MGVFLHFLERLQDHYLWLLGLLFMIEPALDYYVASWREWANHYVSRQKRTRTAISLSVLAAFVACFLAFKDEYDTTLRAQAERDTAIGERNEARKQFAATTPSGQQETISRLQSELSETKDQLVAIQNLYSSRHLTSEQRSIIRDVAKSPDEEKYSVFIFQPSDCRDCNEYATEFIETLTAPSVGWEVKSFGTMHGGINPHFRGIALIVKDAKNPSKASIALANALKAAKIQFVARQTETGFEIDDGSVGIVIGPKEGQ